MQTLLDFVNVVDLHLQYPGPLANLVIPSCLTRNPTGTGVSPLQLTFWDVSLPSLLGILPPHTLPSLLQSVVLLILTLTLLIRVTTSPVTTLITFRMTTLMVRQATLVSNRQLHLGIPRMRPDRS